MQSITKIIIHIISSNYRYYNTLLKKSNKTY
nr:MAG TPA: hypothetical protein [Caudoviricetes sp.]